MREVSPWPPRSRLSALRYIAYIACTPSQRIGSGSHLRTLRPTHGKPGQVSVVSHHQVAQGTPSEVGRRHAVADVPAGPAESGRVVEPDS